MRRRTPGTAVRRARWLRTLAASVVVAALAIACTRAPATEITADPSGPSRTVSVATGSRTASSSTSPISTRGVTLDPVEDAWTAAIDRAVAGSDVSVAVGVDDRIVYVHDADQMRILASNEKLLTSMTALDTFGPGHRFPTVAAATARTRSGMLRSDLWLIGAGDPELTDADLTQLAEEVRARGVHAITGSVIGDTSAFDRTWWAPGWVPGLSRDYVTRTTALALDGNHVAGTPEEVAAEVLTSALRAQGVAVRGPPGTGTSPPDARTLAGVRSDPLGEILARQNHDSVNFDAEMLTKALGDEVAGAPGTTAHGAAAIAAWAAAHGVRAEVFDGSGLSHRDRISTGGLVTLLLLAQRRPWADVLWASLPSPGEGTLEGRLAGVPIRAKTGTLFETPVSALSGYVTSLDGRRLAFSIISRGLDKATAVGIEDAVVRMLAGIRAP